MQIPQILVFFQHLFSLKSDRERQKKVLKMSVFGFSIFVLKHLTLILKQLPVGKQTLTKLIPFKC